MTTFADLGLPESILRAVERMGYSEPTPIQAQSIPTAFQGRDLLGSAQTGTGKTGAFSIPLVAHLKEFPEAHALVLTPTRELAVQVATLIRDLVKDDKDLKLAVIIGGEPYGKQLDQLRRKPRIIVGTPGRINDHLRRGTLGFKTTSFLVLDETDRMLDMGFGEQLDDIVEHMPAERQTLMFSATLPKAIVKVSNKYLVNPHRVSVGATYNVADKVRQEMREVSQDQKYPVLCGEIETRSGSIIVFVKTKRTADELTMKLKKAGVAADTLHGDQRQRVRDKVLRNFRAEKFRVLVATDVAARGLDVPHIEHVINYDLPVCPEDYIHRIGRTARGGAEGEALALVAPHDRRNWGAIQAFLGGDDDAAGNNEYGRMKSKGRSSKPRRSKGGRKGGGAGYPSKKRKDDKKSSAVTHSERPAKSEKPKRSEKPVKSDKPAHSDRPMKGSKPEKAKKFSGGSRPTNKPSKPSKSSGKPRWDKKRKDNRKAAQKSQNQKKRRVV